MKLDGELGRPLEHGTMLGPPTEAERADERMRKERARKVRGGGDGSAPYTPVFPEGRVLGSGYLETKPAPPLIPCD